MPIYEYRCVRCGHQFDVTHAVGKTRARCEKCGGAVRRVFTSVGIIFKGSGFHVNDYRKTPAPSGGLSPQGGDGPAGGVSSPGAPGRGERDRAQGGGAKEGSDGKAAGGGKSAPATEASRGSGSSEKNGKARSATAPSQGAGTKSS